MGLRVYGSPIGVLEPYRLGWRADCCVELLVFAPGRNDGPGLTGTNRARPGLDQALAALREGDTLVVPKLDRLARSVPDARDIGDGLAARGIKLALGGQIYDPTDPMGKMFFNILATFAEFEVDLLRMRTREGWPSPVRRGGLRVGDRSCRPSSRQSCAACTAPATTPSPT